MYLRIRSFWIYTTLSLFKKLSPPLPVCMLKILSILKKKKQKNRNPTSMYVSPQLRPFPTSQEFVLIVLE